MMFSIYLASLIFGGTFVLLSVLSGLGGALEVDKEVEFDKELDFDKDFDFDKELDFDKDFDFDKEVDFDLFDGGDAETELAHAHDRELEVRKRTRRFRPYFSFRFYTFTAAFFGLTGLLMPVVGLGATATFISAVLIGLFAGLGITYLLHVADDSEGGRVASERDMMGTIATVTIPMRDGQIGKVQLHVKGQLVEMMARQYEDDETEVRTIDRDEQCMVLGLDGGVLLVMHQDDVQRKRGLSR